MSPLTPRSIIDAAAADLRARERKRDGRLARGVRYCFVREHVTAADSVPALIALALTQRQHGLKARKRLTRAIYADEDALGSALVEARKRRS